MNGYFDKKKRMIWNSDTTFKGFQNKIANCDIKLNESGSYKDDVNRELVPKMDIVEYIEKVCNFPLMDCQKEFVRKLYDAEKNGKCIHYFPPRCCSRFSFKLLHALVITIYGKECGLLKGEWHD